MPINYSIVMYKLPTLQLVEWLREHFVISKKRY